MRPINIVLAHRDPALTENLARSIQHQFHTVATAHCLTEIRDTIARHRTPLAIVDLELVNFDELGELCREFPATAFVCVHRLADDVMWSRSLSLGAVDCCLASEVATVVQSSDRYVALQKQAQTISAA
jgi:DNA-binding NarL/FixJ family response regulator